MKVAIIGQQDFGKGAVVGILLGAVAGLKYQFWLVERSA